MPLPVWPVLCTMVAAAILISGCSFLLREPEVTVSSVSVSSLNLTALGLDVTLAVNNPNPMGITLSSLAFDVNYQKGTDWVFLAHGEQSGLRIEPGNNTVTLPVTVQNKELLVSLIGLITRGEITLKVDGVAKPDILGLTPSVPFSRTTTIPLRI